jgi:2'-5' RNA ligase
MKRIILYLIRGEAKEAHEAITKDLAERFDSFPMHTRIPPHLTLKRWFELDDGGMEELHKKLDDFTEAHVQSDLNLKDFGCFETKVIYVDVQPSEETLSTIRELMAELHTIEGLSFDEFDDIENDLHASVAIQAWKPFDFDKMWSYLQTTIAPDFRLKFDNVALLKREEDKWEIEKVWELRV